MDEQKVTLLVLLDLSAEIDTIDHSIMTQILENDFGVIDSALSWFTSFLSGRKQRVLINQHQSNDFHLTSGVPQGSCMGPILFIMCTPLGSFTLLRNICQTCMDTQMTRNFT